MESRCDGAGAVPVEIVWAKPGAGSVPGPLEDGEVAPDCTGAFPREAVLGWAAAVLEVACGPTEACLAVGLACCSRPPETQWLISHLVQNTNHVIHIYICPICL